MVGSISQFRKTKMGESQVNETVEDKTVVFWPDHQERQAMQTADGSPDLRSLIKGTLLPASNR